jgi:hypothetical protein
MRNALRGTELLNNPKLTGKLYSAKRNGKQLSLAQNAHTKH